MKNLLMLFKGGKSKSLVAPEKGASASALAGKAAKGKSADSTSTSPYVEARREWNERYGDYISQARNWRFFALFCCMVSLASVIGVSYIGAQNKIVPYVVQVDKFGAAIAVGPGDKAAPVDQNVVKAFLARFIVDWRSVSTDRVAQKDSVVRLYAMLPVGAPAHTKMNDFFRDSNPFVRLQTGTISVELTSALPISDRTWQLEWTEIFRELSKGEIKSKVRYKASLIIGVTPPTDERQVFLNPLGVYVTDFNVAQQL